MRTNIADLPADYKTDLDRAVRILKEGGCREVYVFGSIARGESAEHSDIDLAVRGCPPERFFPLLGKLLVELDHVVDLIDLDRDRRMAEFLEAEGELVHVG